MRRLAVVLAVLLATLGATAVVPPPGAAGDDRSSGRVLLDPLPSRSEVGRRVRMTGTAPADRTVVIERRRGSDWVAVARTRSKSDRTFVVRVPMTRAGRSAYRAAVVGGRRSGPRTLLVFRWLWVTEQPAYTDGRLIWDRTTKTPGKSLPHSIEGHDGSAVVVVKVGPCDRADAFASFPQNDPTLLEGDEFQELFLSPVRDGDVVGESQQSIGADNAGAPPRRLAVELPHAEYLAISASFEDADGNDPLPALIGSPRVHCAAESLPEIDVDEVPS